MVVFVCALALPAAPAFAGAPPVTLTVELPEDGTSQGGRYLVALPDPAEEPPALIVALHGAASSPEAMAAMTGLVVRATHAGIAVALPASAGVLWNDGRSRMQGLPEVTTHDDVAFVQGVVADAVKRFGLDSDRVTLVGEGSGGTMALQLACRLPGIASAVVVVEASLWDYQERACAATLTASLLILHGDDDPRRPWDGRSLSTSGVSARALGVSDTLTFWARRLGCTQASADGAALLAAGGCPSARFVAAVRVAGGAGAWAASERTVTIAGERELALGSSNLDATDIAVAVAGGTSWRPLVPATPRTTAPTPGRSFAVYLPAGLDPASPVPLVVMLHGRGDSGYGMAAMSGMNAVAATHGFAVAYPESRTDSWNFYEGVPAVVSGQNVSDLAFLRRLVERIALDLAVDRKRIFLAGFSNGGFMAERAACALSDEFAAFAVVSAEMLPEMAFNCAVVPTAPMLLIHGTADAEVPWDGIVREQQGARRYATLPVPQTLAYWTLRNVCPFLPQQDQLPDGSDGVTHVMRLRYLHCAFGRDVWFYAVQGGGHNWPGSADVLSAAEAGNITTAMRASDEIWTFFERYPLDPRRTQSPLSSPSGMP